MKQYLNLLQYILDNGKYVPDRTGVGTLKVFGHQAKFDISNNNFPLLTTKKLHWKSIVHELLWFLQGEHSDSQVNTKYLKENGVRIWDEWADKDGNLGPIYGKQWRNWKRYSPAFNFLGPTGEYNSSEIDQIEELIKGIKENPWGRRHIVSAWNVGELDEMALPPCHCFFQMDVEPGPEGKPEFLNCQLYQRSCDAFLGVPFNIASYSLLTYMIGWLTGLKPKTFTHTYGDLHIYINHINQVREQLTRQPWEPPKVFIVEENGGELKTIDDFKFKNFALRNYSHAHPNIKGDIAI